MKRIILVFAIFILVGVFSFISCQQTSPWKNVPKEQKSFSETGVKVEQNMEETGEEIIIEDEEDENQESDVGEITEDLETEEEHLSEDKEISSEEQTVSNDNEEEKIEYANDVTLIDIDGNKVSLSDFQGKVIVFNLWATWCPPCREEIPDFIDINNIYKDKNVQVIGISIDTDIKTLKDFVEEFGIEYPIWIDGTIDHVSPVWGISAIPTTFILNEYGEVIFSNIGMMTKDQLKETLDGILYPE